MIPSVPATLSCMPPTDDETAAAPEQTCSPIARSVRHLQEVTLAAARKRERIPQPLFWSLFHAQVAAIKRDKELRRVVDSLFK